MEIKLPPELERYVRAQVESGLFRDESEVIGHVLRWHRTFDEREYEGKLAALRTFVQEGVDALERGEVVEDFSMDDIQRRLDAKLGAV